MLKKLGIVSGDPLETAIQGYFCGLISLILEIGAKKNRTWKAGEKKQSKMSTREKETAEQYKREREKKHHPNRRKKTKAGGLTHMGRRQ